MAGPIRLLQADGTTAPPIARDFGDYELLQEIGQGGMGLVFKARQRSLDRIVALKLIRAGSLARAEDVARFRTEAAAAGRLRHPHIVAIHEAGEHSGQHYFSMEFVPGHSLAGELRRGPFPPREAARLVESVAEAIHYAHQRGVLHRDLKPSNILLDVDREPRVADFGLAKLLQSDSGLTATGAVMGSPHYMPPEQARGGSANADARSDVYSLGAILYELLSGQPPFAAETPLATMRQVLDDEPRRPSSIQAGVDRDLETICLKCLEKASSRRYDSALALAGDLERWRRGEPILARPGGLWEQMRKWVVRKPAWAAFGALALIAPAAIIALLLVQGANLRRERDRARTAQLAADRSEKRTRLNLYLADMQLAQAELENANLDHAIELLNQYRPASPGEKDLRGFEWRWLWSQTRGDEFKRVISPAGAVVCLAVNPQGGLVAIGKADGSVQFLDPETWNPAALVSPRLASKPSWLAFSDDGCWLCTLDVEGRGVLWNWRSGQALTHFTIARTENVRPRAVFAPRTNLLAYASVGIDGEPQVRVVQVDTNTVHELWRVAGGQEPLAWTTPESLILNLGPDLVLWDNARQAISRKLGPVATAAAVSPDGQWLAVAAAAEPEARLYNLRTDESESRLVGHAQQVLDLTFSADSTLLATMGVDRTIRLWDPRTRQPLARLKSRSDINCIRFIPGEATLASGHADGIHLWNTGLSELAPPLTDVHPQCVLSSDGRWLAAARRGPPRSHQIADRGEMLLLDATRWASRQLPEITNSEPVCFADNGQILRALSRNGPGWFKLQSWHLPDGSQTAACDLRLGNDSVHDRFRVWTWAVSADGAQLALGEDDGTVRLWNAATGTELPALPPTQTNAWQLTFSPDGRTLAVGCMSLPGWDWQLSFWDLPHRRLLARTPPLGADIYRAAFSTDGEQFAVPCDDETVRLYAPATGRETGRFANFKYTLTCVTFSPDGRSLALGASGGAVTLIDLATQREMVSLARDQHRSNTVRWLAFSPDGNTLLGCDSRGSLRRWSAPTLEEIERRDADAR